MWSERARIENIPVVQTAHAPVERDTYDRFVERVSALTEPPFEGPSPTSRIPRFGTKPHAVSIAIEGPDLTIRAMTREPENANATLRAFLEAVGERAAADVGLALALTPALVSIPPDVESRFLHLPRTGDLEPCYHVRMPLRGAPIIEAEGWMTEPITLTCMHGHTARFRVWNAPDEPDIPLLDAAIANMRAATPALLEDATEHVYRYYLDIADEFDETERQACGIPEIDRASEVWRHVQLGSHASVSISGTGSPNHHDGVAYVRFECECDWEQEHGLGLVFIDGERLGRVSSFDGHPTWASAYDDPSLLDVIYKPQRP